MSTPKRKKKANPVGRPWKYNPETICQIEKYLEAGNTLKDSAILSNVGESTVQEWKHKFPELTERFKKAEITAKAQHIANVRRHAFGLDGVAVRWTASAWWLERKFSDEFGQRYQAQFSGPGGKAIHIDTTADSDADISKFTDAKLDKIIEATAFLIKNPTKSSENGTGETNGKS